MTKYIKPFFILFISTFLLNFVLQGLVLREWNDSHLSGIRNTQIQPLILVVNYLIQSAGLLFFLSKLGALGKPKMAAGVGALYGFLLFVNLGLSNFFLVEAYPFEMVISDTLVTVVILAAAGALAAHFSKSNQS